MLLITLILSASIKTVVSDERLTLEYAWTFINFTWESKIDYNHAIHKRAYIPENNIPTGIRIYKDRLYIALGRLYPGTPVTLAYLTSIKSDRFNQYNPALTPFPSWDMNVGHSCNTLQNVYNLEIDTKGIMWILDGLRTTALTNCPPKLVLMNVLTRKIVQTHTFPEFVAKDSFLDDIVVDGAYAYITDNSRNDPGLIIYSRNKNKSWKLRDSSMFPQMNAINFTIEGTTYKYYSGLTGIALTPIVKYYNTRYVYFNALSSYDFYKINASLLQDEVLTQGNLWRKDLVKVGTKIDQSAALTMDNRGNMYFGLLNKQGLAKWNIYQPFKNAKIIFEGNKYLDWADGFAFNEAGRLYVLTNGLGKYLVSPKHKQVDKNVKFRILRIGTTNKSYLYQ